MHQGGHLVLVEATSDQGINCTWKIDLSKTNKVIELYLRIFDILATDGCTSDHVKVNYLRQKTTQFVLYKLKPSSNWPFF